MLQIHDCRIQSELLSLNDLSTGEVYECVSNGAVYLCVDAQDVQLIDLKTFKSYNPPSIHVFRWIPDTQIILNGVNFFGS